VSTDDLPRGAALMVLSALLFAGMGLGVKLASASVPVTMVVFVRSAIGLALLLPWALARGTSLRTRRLGEHLARGLAGLGAMYCFFYALGRLRLADAVLLNYSLPLFMPFVESVWLREPFPPRLWSAIGLGFAGIVLILKPGLGLFQPAAVVGLAAALFAAVAQVGVRGLTRTEPIARIIFYFGLISTAVAALPVAVAWDTPPRAAWVPLAATGLLGTAAQFSLTSAYSHAPAARVGPFIYSSVVFAGALDWLFFGKLPDPLSVAGAVLVAGAGVLTLRITAVEAAPE
jgi:drug/metabolite transporter (DMT)-like permease